MYLKFPYPDLPVAPNVNAHHFFWDRTEQAEWPQDLTLYIDAKTGAKQTYQEFRERVWFAATALGAPISEGGLGIQVEDGEVVAIISRNSSDYAALVHALLILTVPIAVIPPYSDSSELQRTMGLMKPTRIFASPEMLPSVLPLARKMHISEDKVYLFGGAGNSERRKSFEEMIEIVRSRKTTIVSTRPATKDTLACLIVSSGTSGGPKVVMISHGNLIFLAQQRRIFQGDGRPRIHLSASMMAHTAGFQICCFCGFDSPATFVILEQWDTEEVLKAIAKYKITDALIMPSMIHQVVSHPQLRDFDLNSLEIMTSASVYLAQELATSLLAALPAHTRLVNVYGLTESGGGVISSHPSQEMRLIPNYVGILRPGLEARIVRDDGSEADVNESGELYIRGGGLALGYFHDAKATQDTFINGWLQTGDIFRADEDGHFFFIDRARYMLKVDGLPVSTTEIENVLRREPRMLFTDVAVAGVLNTSISNVEVPRAWIVLSGAGKEIGADAAIKELEKWHREVLGTHMWLKGGIEVVDKIPRSPYAKKVLKYRLQDEYHRATKASEAEVKNIQV